MTEPARRKRRGCCLGCTIAIIVAVVIPILAWLIATAVTGARLRAELDRLRKAGEPVDIADFGGKLAPHVPPGVDNAAPLYQEAFDRRRDPAGMETLSSYSPEKWTAKDRQTVRTFVATNPSYFALLDQASRIEQCEFPVNWDDPINALFPHFAKLRETARALTLKAELEVADGKLEAAVASCATSLRTVKHAETTPVLIGQLVAVAIQGISLKELARVLSAGTPSVTTCRKLFHELDDPNRNQYWVNSMKGERLFGLDIFARAEQGTFDPAVFGGDEQSRQGYAILALATVGRPLFNTDKRLYLEFMEDAVIQFSLPWQEAQVKVDASDRRQHRLPGYAILTQMLLPIHARALWSRDKAAAELGAARIALAAKAFQGERGRYPTSLTELAQAGWQLPLDPFTGKVYLYRREGPGFAVWSTGFDLKDNNATEIDYQKFKTDQPGYDFVFRCAR